ncbi:MAG: class I SAM-dependent methyltransferase [Candidatus Aenigmarchaeota archaeon]|nr:class I SAM-dependent methyltransferase [Candidatus Aenigmarchaeota archaeon]
MALEKFLEQDNDTILKQDRDVIESNIAKALEADRNGRKGYFIDSSLEKYKTFVTNPYNSYQDMVEEKLRQNGKCRVLEIGCGNGYAAHEIVEMFGNDVDYHVLNISEPDYRKGINWVEADMDRFISNSTYDIIFSANGIIYGHNDYLNFFKFANALGDHGLFVFNFDWTNAIGVEKHNRFYDFMECQLLDALYASGMSGYCENAMGRRIYLGRKDTKRPLNPEKILNMARKLSHDKRSSYVSRFGEDQKWISYGRSWTSGLRNLYNIGTAG